MRRLLFSIALAGGLAGCASSLWTDHGDEVDAPPIDAPAIDGGPVDGPPIDGPPIDARVDAAIDAPAGVTLAVALSGTGTGTVVSNPAGIDCGLDCTQVYPSGTPVVLTATAASGSSFLGWAGGGCTGTGTCGLTVTAATTVTAQFSSQQITRLGHTTPFTESSSHSPNFLLGEQLVVPQSFTLRQFGVLGRGAGPHLKMALYTDVAGSPGTLVAQTASTALVVGTLEVDAVPANVVLAPGTYWIVGVVDTLASIGYTTMAGANTVKYVSLPFTSPLPTSFGAPTSYTGQSFNYWIVVQ